ncbi:MAG: TatD family hydrolase, partial [Burkholderiales bacterium]
MEWIDTHAHVYDELFAGDQQQIIERSVQASVKRIYLPSIDVTTIEPMLALEAKYPQLCAAMIGIHPCYIKDDFEEQLKQMEGWLSRRAFAAIGEVGIDLYHDRTYQTQQEAVFVTQINW